MRGWGDGSVGKGPTTPARGPEFRPPEPKQKLSVGTHILADGQSL